MKVLQKLLLVNENKSEEIELKNSNFHQNNDPFVEEFDKFQNFLLKNDNKFLQFELSHNFFQELQELGVNNHFFQLEKEKDLKLNFRKLEKNF